MNIFAHGMDWRPVDLNDEVPDTLVQSKRGKWPPRQLLWKLLKKRDDTPSTIVTDKLKSNVAAARGVLAASSARAIRRNGRTIGLRARMSRSD